DAMSRYAWAEAVDHFTAADTAQPLGPRDLEAFAEAAEWCDQRDHSLELYRRAFAGYQTTNERACAARVALHITYVHYQNREQAIASGWIRRAEQLLSDVPECAEHGQLHWLISLRASASGDSAAGLEHAEQALAVGTRVGD